MKTITALLTAVIFASAAGTAMADQQRSDEAPDYALSWQAAQGSGGAYASARREHHRSRGPYASTSRGDNPRVYRDFGNDPDIINFQEQGSH